MFRLQDLHITKVTRVSKSTSVQELFSSTYSSLFSLLRASSWFLA
jgi:hypothetical protein